MRRVRGGPLRLLALAAAALVAPAAPADAARAQAAGTPACASLRALPDASSPAGELAAALARAEGCLQRARGQGAGAARLEAEALYALAELRGLEGSWEAALRAAEEAAPAARAIGDPELAAWAENARGDALYGLWRFEAALAAFERSRAAFVALGDPRGEATALKNAGIAHVILGRRDLAMLRLEEAMERHAAEDDHFAVSVLGNLGTIYARLGAPRSARRAYRRALELARATARPSEVSDVLGRLAYLSLWLGRNEESYRTFAEALEQAELAGPTAALPLLEGAAQAAAATGRQREAELALDRLLGEHRRLGNRLATCLALVAIGRLRESRDPGGALAAYREAESLAARGADRCRWEALAGHGRVARRLGERDVAVDKHLGALAAVERRWRRAVSDVERTTLVAAADPSVRELVALLVERGEERGDPADLALAFGVLERARTAGLTRAIAEARRGTPEPMRALEEEVRDLRRRVDSAALGEGEREELEDLLARRETQLDEYLRNARRAAGRPVELRALGAAEVLRLLPADAGLVSYLVNERETLVFVLAGGALRVERLPVARRTVVEQVEGFVDLLRESGQGGWARVGHRLHRDLVAPWLDTLPAGVGTLVIVPDPALGSLPFDALPREPGGGSPLIEDLAIAYAPSATALSELAPPRRPAPAGIVVLTGPGGVAAAGSTAPARRLRALYEEDGHDLAPLPFGELEAREVAARAGRSGRYLDPAAATEAWVKSQAPERAAVLHFATHGLLSPGDPRRSALLLAADPQAHEDGFLQAREIEQLRLAADLVVLSACRTARGQGLPGEAVQSLAEAFFRAGARSVVGTLWEVEDRAAMRLMSAFYRHLEEGRGKAEALRRAKLELLGRGAEPRDWAGFVLLGEPAGTVPALAGSAGSRAPAALALVLGLAAAGGAWALGRRARR